MTQITGVVAWCKLGALASFLSKSTQVSSFSSPTTKLTFLSNTLRAKSTVRHDSHPPTSSSPPLQDSFSTLTFLGNIDITVRNMDVSHFRDLLGLVSSASVSDKSTKTKRMTDTATSFTEFSCGSSRIRLREETRKETKNDFSFKSEMTIGLLCDDLKSLKDRAFSLFDNDGSGSMNPFFNSYEIGIDLRSNREYIRFEDVMGNVYYCREQKKENKKVDNIGMRLVTCSDEKVDSCQGIEYVEFQIPHGTASKVATFYDCVFDATVSTVQDGDHLVAIVALGNVDVESGGSDQSILFRESNDDDEDTKATIKKRKKPMKKFADCSLGMFVGLNKQDFELAFKNCEQAGLLSPSNAERGDDRGVVVHNLNGAKQHKSFRFKNVVDLRNGNKILDLEHEIRSVEHGDFPGWAPIHE